MLSFHYNNNQGILLAVRGYNMVQIRKLQVSGYEKVIEGIDEESGLHCYIAIHNTKLGPALGGTRCYPYENKEQALEDVLRLSEGMTYKSALAQVGFGGGKAVIMADPYTQKTTQLLLAYAEVVNALQGEYISAEDVGTTTADMEIMRQKTPFLVGLPSITNLEAAIQVLLPLGEPLEVFRLFAKHFLDLPASMEKRLLSKGSEKWDRH